MLVAGLYAPPFQPEFGQEGIQDIIDRINNSTADIVWVGLGSAKQDFWMQIAQAFVECPCHYRGRRCL